MQCDKGDSFGIYTTTTKKILNYNDNDLFNSEHAHIAAYWTLNLNNFGTSQYLK